MKSDLAKFNLNNYILVQITEYGWDELYKKKSIDYVEHCIKRHEEVIDGEKWYRLQAHEVITTFGSMLFMSHPAPIKSNILIP